MSSVDRGAATPLGLLSVLLLLACTMLVGCTALAPRGAVRETQALRDVAGTPLATTARQSVAAGGNGFRLIVEPAEALDARLALIEQAQLGLDMQYFIWSADASGRLLLQAVRDAAARGVRVRLLLDDFHTAQVEPLLDALSGYPGIEVRLFNPFPAGRTSTTGRVVASLVDMKRIRHRMHNKLMVADNAAAITGGRNVGDAYLAAGEGNFLDVDLLAMGPIVREMSASFDEYWNSEHAYPIGSLTAGAPDSLRRERFTRLVRGQQPNAAPQMRGDTPNAGPAGELRSGRVALQACEARLHADPVAKAAGRHLSDPMGTLHQRLVDTLVGAQREILIASPYFVRGRAGVERIKALRDRGIRMRLLTNSGSATDEPLAHAVYLRYRSDLMRAGVEIREFIASDGPQEAREPPGTSASRLHAKLAVVDGRQVYVGSLNFTGRSERINTELGLILDCPALAAEVTRLIESAPAYELRWGPGGHSIEWMDGRMQPPRVRNEPELTAWQFFLSMVVGPFVPEEEI